VSVSAPAEAGRANEAVLEYLGELLGVKRRQLTLERGASSRSKVVAVEGMSAEAAQKRLQARLAEAMAGAEGKHEPDAEADE